MKMYQRSQSAMEYLMTYGWAILIIAVVLGVLFQLGVFSGNALAPRAQPGSCSVQRLLGQVSLEGLCQGQLPQYAAFLSGATSYTHIIISSQQFPSGSSPRTITAWIQDEKHGSGNQVVFMQGSAGSGNCLAVWESNAGGVLVTTWYHDQQIAVPGFGTWFFVAAVYNGINETGYAGLNSKLSSAMLIAPLITASPTSFWIGDQNPQGQPFNGTIANVQFYNSTLTQNEITALYLEGIGGAPIRIQNLVGWWPLNGNFNDYSGNSDNGQAVGTVSFNSTWNSQYTPP